MNAPEFRQRVMAQERPGLSRESLAFAVEYFVSQHRLSEGDVRACIELAGRLEAAYPPRQIETAVTATSPISISPGALIASEKWAAELRPWVEQMRQDIFGNTQPPFKTYEDAVQALKGTTQEVSIDQATKEITT